MSKPILCLDFDGVIHSYSSGWKGKTVIPDEPVPGALKFIVEAMEDFQVCIFSSRSDSWLGRRAMKKWLKHHLSMLALDWDKTPEWLLQHIYKTSFADPWEDEVDYSLSLLIKEISWPKHKPPALITIDDRAMTFAGIFPTFEAIKEFKPWNKP